LASPKDFVLGKTIILQIASDHPFWAKLQEIKKAESKASYVKIIFFAF